MRKIPKTFQLGGKKGFTFNLLKREGSIAIYEQLDGDGIIGYEVHKIRVRKPVECKYTNPDGSIKLVKYPEREVLAGNEDFGKYGWSCETLKEAEAKLKELKEVK